MGKIVAVCISERKGQRKNIGQGKLVMDVVWKDAHAGAWHRQVSLAMESIEKCGRKG